MGQTRTLQLLKELGGRATAEQIRQASRKQDPFSSASVIGGSLWRLCAWKEVDYDGKTNEWFIPQQH
jgi:hypothetical protein